MPYNDYIFDTHSHYNSEEFITDIENWVNDLDKANIKKIVTVSSDYKSNFDNVSLANKYSSLYASIGIHPCDCMDFTEEKLQEIKSLVNEKVVAVGEIGLDYYWDDVPRDLQKKWFIRQLQLADELELPVIIHSRDAAEDTLKIMKENGPKKRGIIHCFSYSKEIAKEYVKMGYYLGIGGVVTFKNARVLKEVVENIDLENMVIETDCPYLAPEPFRGKLNSSLYLTYVIDKIAELKNISSDTVRKITYENGLKVYGLE